MVCVCVCVLCVCVCVVCVWCVQDSTVRGRKQSAPSRMVSAREVTLEVVREAELRSKAKRADSVFLQPDDMPDVPGLVESKEEDGDDAEDSCRTACAAYVPSVPIR